MKSTLYKRKRYVLLMLSFVLLSSLTACSSRDTIRATTSDALYTETEGSNKEGNQTKASNKEEDNIEANNIEVNNTEEDNTERGNSDIIKSNQEVDTPEPTIASDDREVMISDYKSILEDVYYNHTFPDGQLCDWFDDTSYEDMSDNKFSIYDIDHDNKEELILLYTTASMAGMVEIIYDFDSITRTSNEEFREFPALTYYDNGIIKAEWSHNQGLAGEFWPYSLYQYDSESDTYVNIGMVDAWDRSLSEVDYNGNAFPSDSDTDGDGILYYVMKDGEYKLEHEIDGPEYEQWIDSYIGNGEKVDIPYEDMTEENIENVQ